ncbi:Legumin A [Hibiscus syriacus]|uniref:Legumin A n=1 Tax=Hibiscus syriacus TaxID=106335 RepID=A0A6A2WLE9_HIBSY|nr:Legumin A [Hibiscus syriacus]
MSVKSIGSTLLNLTPESDPKPAPPSGRTLIANSSGQGQGQQGHGRFQDQHQKIRRFRKGDIIALPAGFVHWFYNDGNERLVTVNLLHTANTANQLDNNPRGSRSEREEEEEEEEEDDNRSRRHEQQSSSCSNLLCAFESEFLAQSFNVDTNIIRKLQEVRGHRGSIIRVKDRLDVVSPHRMEEEEREERQQEERRREHHREGRDNGLEESFCAKRIKENIADPERADIFNPQAGRISTLNRFNLPILNALALRNGCSPQPGTVPQWCINAHKILYMLNGSARIRVVNQNGNTVFDDNVEQGQLLTVPQRRSRMGFLLHQFRAYQHPDGWASLRHPSIAGGSRGGVVSDLKRRREEGEV